MRETKNYLFLSVLLGAAALFFWSVPAAPQKVGGAFVHSNENLPISDYRPPVPPAISADVARPDVSARAMLVADLATGARLLEKRPDTVLPMASLTKLMTALVVDNAAARGEIVTIRASDAAVPMFRAGLAAGEKITVKNLLYAMIISSANDAAGALARHVGPGEENFVSEMNDYAAALGMSHTSFANPVGFDDPKHYSTASDLYLMAREFLLRPGLVEIAGVRETAVSSTDGKRTHILLSTNILLSENENVKGLKTGFTEEARGNLILLVERGGERYLVILLGSDEREEDARKIIDWAEEALEWNS